MTTRTSPKELRARLQRIAAPQGGYFTAQQALEAGYSYPAQHYHSEGGSWERVDRAIYRLRDWPAPEHPDLIRWTLWTEGSGVVSHESALSVREIGDFMPGTVHITIPTPSGRSAPGVKLHTAELPSEDIDQREGFSLTTPERSLLDVAAVGVEPDQLEIAIEEAMARGVTNPPNLRARADAFGAGAKRAIERALAGR